MSQEKNNAPRETGGTNREDVHANALQMLESMRERIDGQQRELVLEMIKNEKLSAQSLTAIDTMLDTAQREYAKDPTRGLQILDRLIEVGQDGEITAAELSSMKASMATTPASMEKIGSMVEKMSSMMNGLSEQLGGLGSGTLKMLAGFFGPDSFLGKAFAMLKDTPKAQLAYIEKKLLEQQKTLSTNVDPQQILSLMRTQITQCQNAERRAKRAPTYDIVQHVEQIMAEIDSSKTELTLDDFKVAGEKVIANYAAELSAIPPPAVAAAPTPAAPETGERQKKQATPSAETTIAKNDSTPLKVVRESDGVKFDLLGKTAAVKNVTNVAITSADVMDPTEKEPGAVVLTLVDSSKIEIAATELKAAATDATKKTIVAKNLTTKADLTLEIAFS